jgi:hypothetical protein
VVGGEMVLQAQWIVPGGTEERRKETSARAWRGSTFPMASPVSVTTCLRFLFLFFPLFFVSVTTCMRMYTYACVCVCVCVCEWGSGVYLEVPGAPHELAHTVKPAQLSSRQRPNPRAHPPDILVATSVGVCHERALRVRTRRV